MRDPPGGVPPEAEFERHLFGVAFPASRDDLLRRARSNGAPEDVLGQLRAMPSRSYEGLDDLVRTWREQASRGGD